MAVDEQIEEQLPHRMPGNFVYGLCATQSKCQFDWQGSWGGDMGTVLISGLTGWCS